jgi:hypothetical protein
MKAIGEKCCWVISRKERRILKLLRTHARECDHAFVTNCPAAPRPQRAVKIQVEFAQEHLSAFDPPILVKTKPDRGGGDRDHE